MPMYRTYPVWTTAWRACIIAWISGTYRRHMKSKTTDRLIDRCSIIEAMACGGINEQELGYGSVTRNPTLEDLDVLELEALKTRLHSVENVLEDPSESQFDRSCGTQ